MGILSQWPAPFKQQGWDGRGVKALDKAPDMLEKSVLRGFMGSLQFHSSQGTAWQDGKGDAGGMEEWSP